MNLGFDLKEWESVQGVEMGEYETLNLGGHIVEIKTAGLYTGKSGNTSLRIEVDTAKNDKQPGFFQKQYDDNNNADKKWSNGATKYFSLKTDSLKYLRGFVETTLPNSNASYKFDKTKGWEQLVGLKCAGVFGLEEYEKQDGTTGFATKLVQFRSIDKLDQIKIPKVKLLNGTAIDYEEYKNRKNDIVNISQVDTDDDVIAINPEDLPF